MARRRRKTRRKLSKPALIVLVLVGLMIVAGGSLYAYRKWPRDPQKFLARAEAAHEEGDLPAAERFLQIAINNAGRQERTELQSELYILMSEYQLEAYEDPNLLPVEKDERLRNARGSLHQAARVDPDNLDAQQRLTQMYWDMVRMTGGNNGQVNEAYRAEATKLIGLRPENDETYFRRGMTWSYRARRVPGEATVNALKDFDKAIELDPNEVEYRLTKATFLEQMERPREAEQVYQTAIEQVQEPETVRIAYARFLRRQNRIDEARSQYQQILQADPDSVAGNLGFADFSISQRDIDSARQSVERAMQADPNDPRVYATRSVVAQASGDLAKAAEAMRQARNLVAERAGEIPEDRQSVGWRRMSQYQVAELDYKLAEILLNLVTLHANEPETQQALIAEAEEILDRLDFLEEDHPWVNKIGGMIAMYQGRLDEAATKLRSAYDQFASTGRVDQRTGYFLISVYNKLNQPGKADQLIDQLRRLPSAARQPFLHLQDAYIKLKYRQYEQAAQALDRVLAALPSHQDALNLRRALAVILTDNASVPEHLEVDDRVATLFLQYASRLIADGRAEDARTVLEQLHQKAPQNIQVTLQLASFYGDQDEEDQVLRVLSTAAEHHPENKALRRHIELVENTDPNERFEARLALADEEADPAIRALKKANICRVYRKHDLARQYLREALEAKPDNAAALAQLFRYALDEKNWSRAKELADQAATHNIDQAGGRMFRAQLALAREDTDRAIRLLEEAVAENDALKNAWALLGRCYLQTDTGDPVENLNQAERCFRSALNADASYVPAILGMAQVAQKQGDQKMYEMRIKDAYRLSPRHPEIRSRYLALMEDEANVEDTIRSREQIYKTNPSDLQNSLRLAALYEKQGRLDDAQAIYQFIYEKGRPRLTGAAHLAHFFGRTERYNQAERIITNLIRTEKDKVGAYLLYADVFEDINTAQAQGALRNAIKADPDDPRGYRALAQYYAQRDQWDSAVGAMTKVMELDEPLPLYRKELARLLLNAGRPQPAMKHLDIVLDSTPNDPQALALKGRALTLLEQLDEAEEMLKRSISLAPGAPQPHQYLATIHELRGDVDAAATDLRRAWTISENPAVGRILAMLYRKADEPAMAEQVYREVLEQSPEDMEVLNGLRSLLMAQRDWQALEKLLMDLRLSNPRDERSFLWEAEMWSTRRQTNRVFEALQRGLQRIPSSTALQMALLENLRMLEMYSRIEPQAKQFEPDVEHMPLGMRMIVAVARARTGETDSADRLFLDAVKNAVPSELSMVVARLAQAYGADEALKRLNAWKQHRVQEPFLYERMGQLYMQRGQPGDLERAADAFQRARSLTGDPDLQAGLDRSLGGVYYLQKQWSQAENAWLSALKVLPTDVALLNNIAYLYAEKLDQPAKGLPYAEKARRLEPTDSNVLDTHGWVQAKAGQLDRAQTTLERVVSMDATNPTFRYHLGWVLEQSGRPARAGEQYEQADELLDQQPDAELQAKVNEALERVRQSVE